MVKLLGHLKIIAFSTILGFIFLACSENIPKLDYHKIERDGDSINLCEIHKASWDSILIIAPYSRKSLWENIENINSIREELNQMQSIDWRNYLILLKGQTAVGYMAIPRDYVDFDYKNESGRKIIYKEKCKLDYNNGKIVISNNKKR
jgi:hypothetical protein